jgi:protein-tyrosine-phosphatase
MSAGTWTMDGLPPVQEAIVGSKRLGLDISGHVSSVITAGLIQDADLVIVMERGQKEALENEFPQADGKVHLLSEVAKGSAYDIPDPLLSASPADGYIEIAELVHAGVDRICALAVQH